MTDQHPPTDHLDTLVREMKSKTSGFRETLRTTHRDALDIKDGAVADYIPELAGVDPDAFGISVVTIDGDVFETGDSKKTFTAQSCSKPFIYGQALEDNGREKVRRRVGVEPSGDTFNAIVLDEVSNRPFNPMVNAGAIATTDMLRGADLPDRLNRMLAMFGRYVGHAVQADSSVFLSERTSGHRNRAIANLMLNFGMVSEAVEQSLELYFQQCSVLVNARDLATMGATLANGGKNPVTGEQALSKDYVKDILCVMYTCGMYDFAGEWAHEVGLPSQERGRRRYRGCGSRHDGDRCVLPSFGQEGYERPRSEGLPVAIKDLALECLRICRRPSFDRPAGQQDRESLRHLYLALVVADQPRPERSVT